MGDWPHLDATIWTTAMRLICSCALLFLALQTAPLAAQQATTPDGAAAGLAARPGARAQLSEVRPGADWTKFRTIELGQLKIPLDVRDAGPSSPSRKFRESYVLRDKDVAALQQDFDKAMREQLSQGGFTFVTTPGPDTLIIAAQVIDIKLNAPIESTRVGYSGRSRTYSRGGGTIAVGAVFADGETGQVLARVADRYYPADVWGINNSVANRAEARRAFSNWGRDIRKGLGDLRGTPSQ
jgi:hypothetical protein